MSFGATWEGEKMPPDEPAGILNDPSYEGWAGLSNRFAPPSNWPKGFLDGA